jgi:WD40 repeat protein
MTANGFHLTALCLSLLLTFVDDDVLSPRVIRPTAAVFNKSADEVLIGSQSGLQIYSWPDFAERRRLHCPLETVLDLCLSADGRKVLVAGGTAGECGQLQILDLSNEPATLVCSPHSDRITRARWLPGERQILTASDDGSAAVLDATTGNVLRRVTLHSRPLLALECIGDNLAASAGMDGMIRLWQPDDGRLLRTLDNHTAPITDMLSHTGLPDNAPPILYSASQDRTVRLWQPIRGRMVRFVRLNSIPESLALTADHQRLLAGCRDGSLQILHADTLQILNTLPPVPGPVTRLLIHPSTNPLATPSSAATQSTNALVLCGNGGGYRRHMPAPLVR